MSMEAVWAFRERVSADAALGNEVKAELAKKDGDLAAVARRHGFDVTKDELEQGWATACNGELTPFELEIVSAGAGSNQGKNYGAIGGTNMDGGPLSPPPGH